MYSCQPLITLLCALSTYRLNNSILVGRPEALGALVLLLALLVIPRRGRSATRGPCSGATPLLAKEVDGVEGEGLVLRGRGGARGCRSFRRRRNWRGVGGHRVAQSRVHDGCATMTMML
jgi:hypothetical protein